MGLRVASLNIGRGYFSKFSLIEDFITSNKFNVIVLSETDLNQYEKPVPINGYDHFTTKQESKKKLIMYVESKFRPVQQNVGSAIPALHIDLAQISIGAVYNEFFDTKRIAEETRKERLMCFLQDFADKAKDKALIVGDFNIDWLKTSNTKKLVEQWSSEAEFEQQIDEPTRPTSGTAIDLVFTRKIISNTIVTDPHISDHKATISTMSNVTSHRKKKNLEFWSVKITPEIINLARNTKVTLNPDDSFSENVRTFHNWFDRIIKAATRKITRKTKDIQCPWYDHEVKRLKSKLRKAEGPRKKKLRNKLVNLLRKKKKKFVQIEVINQNTKGVWATVHKKKSPPPDHLIIDNKKTEGDKTIANELAKFFENKVGKLKKKANLRKIKTVLNQEFPNPETFGLKPVSVENVARLIDSLKPKQSAGPDQISYRMLKELKFEIVQPLSVIINQSIKESHFAKCWKRANIIPIKKKPHEKNNTSNFRPIALASSIGKLVELAVSNQLRDSLENVFPEALHGFRKNKSTTTAVNAVLDKVRLSVNNGLEVALVAVDGTAAFDLLDPDLVVMTLGELGANESTQQWVKSYLDCRSYQVKIGDEISDPWTTDTGTPQGGILSTLLYIIGALTQVYASKHDSEHYADDSVDVVTGNNKDICSKNIKEAASDVVQWFIDAGLTPNLEKSEVLPIGNLQVEQILIGDKEIKTTASAKFLGVHLQSNLRWDKQVEKLVANLRRAAGQIRAEGVYLSPGNRKILFNGWCLGLLYSNALAILPWLNESQLDAIQTALNIGVRAVFGGPRFGQWNVMEARNSLGIPTVRNIRDELLAIEAWKKREIFLSEHSHDHHTRSKDVRVPKRLPRHLERLDTHIRRTWNSLPIEIRYETSQTRAKVAIRKLFRESLM